jgi:hypothetical protein
VRARNCIPVVCCLVLLFTGCQSQTPYNTGKPATNWNPFAGFGQTRVPPPGTNQYGTSTVAQPQGFTVPPNTPFGPLPPGATAPTGGAPFNGVRGGAVQPGPGVYGAPQTNVNPNTTDPYASKPGSLGPAKTGEIRRASFEDPASQYPQDAVQPASGEGLSRNVPAPANKLTPY